MVVAFSVPVVKVVVVRSLNPVMLGMVAEPVTLKAPDTDMSVKVALVAVIAPFITRLWNVAWTLVICMSKSAV